MHRRKLWLEGVERRPPVEVLVELRAIEQEILRAIVELERVLR
jgi:hypothetical protein